MSCFERVSFSHNQCGSGIVICILIFLFACATIICTLSLVPRLHSPAFYRTVYKSAFIHGAIKSWGVESGNEAMYPSCEPLGPSQLP